MVAGLIEKSTNFWFNLAFSLSSLVLSWLVTGRHDFPWIQVLIQSHGDGKLSPVGARGDPSTLLGLYCCTNSLKAESVPLLCICAIYSLRMDVTLLLTERIYVFPDYQGEAAACVVNAEEDHGHVLRGAHASPQGS